MALGSPRNHLLQLLWWLTIGVGVLAATGITLLTATPDWPLYAWRLGVIATLFIVCERWKRRDLEGSSILFIGAMAFLTTLDVTIHTDDLAQPQLAFLIQAALGSFAVFALSLLHGWRGAIGGGLLAAWPHVFALGGLHALVIGVIEAFAATTGLILYRLLEQTNQVRRDLEKRANSDAMTRLGNRRGLEDDFRRYRANAKRWGVPLLLIAWDVDGLKRINDSKGHAAGDMHLLNFVQALRAAVRQGDGLYRIGGDEFVSLHPGLSLEDAQVMYDRVLRKFDHVSAGWVRATNDSLDEALREADAKLYEEKGNRRARAPKRTLLPDPVRRDER